MFSVVEMLSHPHTIAIKVCIYTETLLHALKKTLTCVIPFTSATPTSNHTGMGKGATAGAFGMGWPAQHSTTLTIIQPTA